MSFLTPVALAFAGLSIPIIVLYMLKLRRRDVLVSSTLLWQRLLRDREANAPWQRLRRNLLLLLQLLILALVTLALARPFVSVPTVVSGSVVILLDASASMQATDMESGATRFEAARRAALDIVANLGAGDEATIVAVGPQPEVLASGSERGELRRALEEAAPTDGPADWEAAFALAGASLTGARDARAVIISDGAVPETLPPLPGSGEVRFVGVGGGGDNLAITALATRQGEGGPQAFLRVANFGSTNVEPLVEFSANGALFDARRLSVPARGHADTILTDLPYNLRLLQAHLAIDSSFVDSLFIDNTAWTVHAPPASGRVLLISEGNLFLERALAALPGIELIRSTPQHPVPDTDGNGGDEEYALVVCDGAVTGTLPSANLWLIGPPYLPPPLGGGTRAEPEGSAEVKGGQIFTATTITRVASDDPLLRYVDLDEVHVLQARRIEPPPGARVLVEAQGGPLLFVAERPGGRLAVLTFDLRDSDLPLHIAFPILTANLMNWLLPRGGLPHPAGEGRGVVRPGDAVPVQPVPEASQVHVVAPDGTRHVLQMDEQALLFAATDRLGLYRVEQLDRSGELLQSDLFAVNLFDQAESDIAPREVVRVGQTEVTTAMRDEEGRREFWPWLAGAALGVLVVEWWVYWQGYAGQGQGDGGG